jgi:RNA polymerase sigma factor FliA
MSSQSRPKGMHSSPSWYSLARVTSADPSRNAQRRGTGPALSSSPSAPGRERAELAVRYFPLVRRLAHRFRRSVPVADVDELVGAGTVGLMEAIVRFDPGRGVSFRTFAYPRIQGAIVDELRAEITRRHRGRHSCLEEVSLQAPVSAAGGGVVLLDVTADSSSPEPSARAELKELVDAVTQLPAREREMITLHVRGYTVIEIARRQGCSAARASALLSRARLRIAESTAA